MRVPPGKGWLVDDAVLHEPAKLRRPGGVCMIELRGGSEDEGGPHVEHADPRVSLPLHRNALTAAE